jgi:hypothetical protein
MRRYCSAFGWLAVTAVLCMLTPLIALGAPQITNAVVLANNVGGIETGTENTQFIFRADVVPQTGGLRALSQFGLNTPVGVVINVFDPANPELGGAAVLEMFNVGGSTFVAYVPGYLISSLGGIRTNITWSILGRDMGTDGTLQDGTQAAPKPATATLRVVPNQQIEIVPVDENFQPDKRLIPGQLGNGLRVNPSQSTAPNDGGSSHFFTWRVRVRTVDGLPLQFFSRRSNYLWRDPRLEQGQPLVRQYNSGLHLVLIDPAGNRYRVPMEIDPDAPGQAGLHAATYTTDSLNPNTLLRPTGGNIWSNGVYYRFRMLPTQYGFNWGPFPGEGPFTAFGGPTQPDAIPAIPIGFNSPPEIIGRPFTNLYTGFADQDPRVFNLPVQAFPFNTRTEGRAGQWQYYFVTTTDLRPPTRPSFPTNGSINTYPNDLYGADPDAYLYNYDSDLGAASYDLSGFSLGTLGPPYNHPRVTPILSDGGWTDDLPENGYAGGSGRSAHRSRPTTKTRVRFQVRVTKDTTTPLPAQAVRVWIDGSPRTMQPLPGTSDLDYLTGRVFYYDTTFSAPGQTGQHWIYFDVDDGVNRAIWPRRDTAVNGTGDSRYPDPQAGLIPQFNNPVNFGTGIVGKNFLNEPLVNNRPVLSNPTLSPPSGVEAQAYTYEVTYTDADNDEPVDAWVYIDGMTDAFRHRMTPVDNTPTSQGRRYRFVMTQLTPAPSHFYFFKFRDNWNNPATIGRYGISPLRIEYGEWTTLPQGDDNGNPSSVIPGPIITGNRPSELSDAGFTFSDPSQTSATLYDFLVKYRSQDNNPPASITFYLSNDAGATYDGGTAMVKAEGSTNYTAGVLYHLPERIRLPYYRNNNPALGVAQYRFKFRATDGVQPVDTTLVRVGTGINALDNRTAQQLEPVGGSNTVFENPKGTKRWSVSPTTTFVWKAGNGTPTLLILDDPGPLGYTVDALEGRVTLNTPVQSGESVFATYYYLETLGPVINLNAAPTLTEPNPGSPATNNGTLTPLQGGPSTQFTYSIIYTDANNQEPAPGYPVVVVDSNRTFVMTRDPNTPTPIDYTRGVRYNLVLDGATLGNGPHTYHFEASDGADLVRFPPTGDLQGPSVSNIGDIQLLPGNASIQPFPKGKSNDRYTFTVRYSNSQGLAPVFPIELRIRAEEPSNDVKTVQMLPIDPIGENEFRNGVRYQVLLQAPDPARNLVPGTHEITFGFQGQGASTAPLNLIVNGPPQLANAVAAPNPASQAGDIVFSVKYTDVNGDPPVRNGERTLKLFINGQERLEQPTTFPANPTANDFKGLNPNQGVTYIWTYRADQFPVGTHTYYFTAQDDLEPEPPLALPPLPGGSFEILAPNVPQLLPVVAGAPNDGTVNPLAGPQNGQYTYSIRYRHSDGVAPVRIQVIITPDPNRYPAAQPIVLDLTPDPSEPQNPTQSDFQRPNGVLYSLQTAAGELPPGQHRYRYEAADRLTVVNRPMPAGSNYTGPTVNSAPTLSEGTVYIEGSATIPTVNQQNQLTPAVAGNVLTRFIFRVKYTDIDDTGPAPNTMIVTINNSQTLPLTRKSGDFTTGAIYESEPTTLTAGQKSFNFTVSDSRFPDQDRARFPSGSADITGLTVRNIPTLEAPSGGTLSPTSGPISTTFTYQVVYKNADNTPPAYVRVLIDGTPYSMTKVTPGTNYAAGVTYEYQYRFPQDVGQQSHTYSFEAQDTLSTDYVAKLPVSPNPPFNGPTLNVPVFRVYRIQPSPASIGSPVTITGALITQPIIGTPIAVQLVRPDGTGINDTATTSASDGSFSYTFTPTQTGDWKLRLSWGGSAGTYDPLSAEFTRDELGNPFRVTGFTLNVGAGELDMIASPLVPVTPDPSISFSPTRQGTGEPVSVTVLNMVKWMTTTAPSGRYLLLNNDPGFPGIAGGQSYWVRPSESVVLNPRGRLHDQTQPYSIPLKAGWNMVGSVYLQDINWSAVKVRYQGQTLGVGDAPSIVRSIAWTYDKATGGYSIVNAGGVLRPGRGYWVRAFVDCELILSPPGSRAASLSREADLREGSLQIVARMGNRMDTDNFVPLTGLDKTRMAMLEKPPYVANYVTVRLVPTDSAQLPAETRAAAANKTVIMFDVETDRKNADVMVQFPNVSAMGRSYEVTLVDLANGARRALGSNSGYAYNSGDNSTPRRFALLVDTVSNNSRLIISDIKGTGRSAGTLSFSYTISATASVRAQIVGGSGQVVRDLQQGRAVTRGVNTLLWDGKDARGVSVPAGTYLLKLTATDEKGRSATAVLPVTLVR